MSRKGYLNRLRRFIIEELETRRVMAGDTIPSAEYAQLYPDMPYTIASTLGDESQAAADVDMFRFPLQSGQQLTLEMVTPPNTLQGQLRIFNALGSQLTASATSAFSGDPKLTFNVTTTGDYFVGVSAFGNYGYDANTLNNHIANASLGTYRLNIVAKSPVPDNSLATRYVVDTNADVTNPTDGHWSLREALTAANQSSGKSAIEISIPNQSPDFELTQGPLVINSAVSLIGTLPGQKMRIRLAANASPSRLLTVNTNADAYIKNIIFDGGVNSGGDGGDFGLAAN